MALAHQPFTETQVFEPHLTRVPRPEAPRHVKVTGNVPAFGYEPCEDIGCTVAADGIASSCKRIACPNCGFGGTNVTMIRLIGSAEVRAGCTCGETWMPGQKPVYVLTRAETAECTCPDICERDHSNE